ncbi:hypothetical protein [Paeniglutamicibacter cryotolerans]|uniref:Uncharacterized protein n=1 Tax=Paeniglutamicibacter cryotolerans TaxID=670079 RepID=A0A839QMB4_9MICC|nr:hypothetical protein [Paeniglutamicibacter cryotolerans]MBB2997568.1 hypothetical protein [Paeniglutamicibacter cryotolerans]
MSAKPTAAGVVQKRLNFDVPAELAHQFKAYAALEGKSQREIVIAFMQRCVRRSHFEAGLPAETNAAHPAVTHHTHPEDTDSDPLP